MAQREGTPKLGSCAMIEAHALRAEEVLKLLKTSEEGLADEEAQKRLKEFGPNEIEG